MINFALLLFEMLTIPYQKLKKSTFSWTMLEDMEVTKQKMDMRTD
jgi:hypothetical protein